VLRDLARGFGRVEMPTALAKKFPNADHELGWQFVFASTRLSRCPRTGLIGRHHVHESCVQRAVTGGRDESAGPVTRAERGRASGGRGGDARAGGIKCQALPACPSRSLTVRACQAATNGTARHEMPRVP
jgi:hypothetical protein